MMKRKVYVRQLKRQQEQQEQQQQHQQHQQQQQQSQRQQHPEEEAADPVREEPIDGASSTSAESSPHGSETSQSPEPPAALPNVTVLIKGRSGQQQDDQRLPPLISTSEMDPGSTESLPVSSESAYSAVSVSESSSSIQSSDDHRGEGVSYHEMPLYRPPSVVRVASYEPPTSHHYSQADTRVEPQAKDLLPQYSAYNNPLSTRPQYTVLDSYAPPTYTPLQSVSHLEPPLPQAMPLHGEADIPTPSTGQANQSSHEDDMMYGHQVWDQENNAYVSYGWKYHEVTYSQTNGLSVHNNNTASLNNPITAHDNQQIETPSLHHNQQYQEVSARRESSRRSGLPSQSASKSSSSRRRRKRLQTPVQRSAANMRERRRMCHLNVAFDLLKERLPNVKDKKKLSRIQTLKAAIYYIHLLRDSLNIS